jgi:hypothetical protein
MIGPWAVLLHGDIENTNPGTWVHQEVRTDAPRNQTSGTTNHPNYSFQNGVEMPGDGWVYVWCQGPWNTTGSTWLARFKEADVISGNMTEPAWWMGGNRWVKDWSDARGINRPRYDVAPSSITADQPGAVQRRPDGQYQYTLIPGEFKDPDPHINYSLISAPNQKFPELTDLYDIPISGTQFIYGAYTVPNQTWSGKASNDQLMLYSTNNYSTSLLAFTDSREYWCVFVKAQGM